jgi:hypothetical protein
VQNKRNGPVIVCGLAAMLLLGCQNDEIRSYRVPKPEAKPATRLLAVIIPHGDRTWFFKLVGPERQIEQQKEGFDQFIHSVRFTDDAERPITWAVPSGWKAGPASEPRYATFYLGTLEHPVELTVFRFSGATGSVLANVNRWRGQIGLADIQETELGQLSKSLQLECGPATLVDMTNRGGENAVAMGGPDIISRRSGSRSPPHYDKPEGWQERPDSSGLGRVVFQVGEGENTQAAIAALTGDAGGLLRNVNRWRGQIHLGPVDEKQLQNDVRQIEVAGATAPYIDLTGPGSAGEPPQRFLGVALPRGGQTWFFTLRGPADQVGKQKAAFETFLKSVRFEG